MKKAWLAAAILPFLGLAIGCHRVLGDQDGIRAAIQKHLTGNSTLNLAAMDYDVKNISIDRDRAQAAVEFRLKQGGAVMQVNYSLARMNGVWSVMNSQPTGGQIDHPPMNNDVHGGQTGASGTKAVPNMNDFFNAPSAPGAPALPPGHPPVNSLKNPPPPKDSQPSPKKP